MNQWTNLFFILLSETVTNGEECCEESYLSPPVDTSAFTLTVKPSLPGRWPDISIWYL